MKKRLPTNARLVRCPKCSKLLPEPTDVPFYICGGCNTYLQAKHYKTENTRKQEASEDSNNVLPQNNHQDGGNSSDSSPQSIFSAQHSPDPCREGEACNVELPDSIREDSSSNDLCTADTKDVSSHLSIRKDVKCYSELQREEQSVEGETSFGNGANAFNGHENEEVSAIASDFKVVRKGDKLVAEAIGACSSSRKGARLLDVSEMVRNGEDHFGVDDLQNCGREAYHSDASPIPIEFVGKGLSNGMVEQESDHNVVACDGLDKIGKEGREEVSSTDDSSYMPERNKSLSLLSVEDQYGEGDGISGVAASSEKITVLQNKKNSGLPSENQGRVKGKNIQDVNSETIPMSNEVSHLENKEVRETSIENHDNFVGKVQDEPSGTKEEICEEKLHSEIVSPVGVVDSHKRENLMHLPPGQDNNLKHAKDKDEVVGDTDILSQAIHSSDPHGNREEAVLQQPLESNFTTPPGSNTLVEIENSVDHAEVLMTASKSSDAVGENSGPNIEDSNQKIIKNGLRTMTSAKTLEGAEIVDVELEVVEFPKVLPKSPTRGSSVYDGSVSSYDGNDDQNLHVDSENLRQNSEVEGQVAAEGRMPDHFTATNNQIKHSSSNNQAMGSSPENFEGGRSAFRRNRIVMPRTEENFPSRYSTQLTDSEMAYDSSVSSNLMHDEFQSRSYSHLPPQSYRDIGTRGIRRHGSGTMDGRVYSDYDWQRGVPARRPYYGSSGESYPTQSYERYQYPGVRSCDLHYPSGAKYSHAPYYPGEALRSEYRRFHHDPYMSSQPPSEMRWSSSQLSPPRGGYYSRDLDSVRSWKQPLDSYPASPQYVDSVDSYSWGGYDLSTDERRHGYEVLDDSRLQVRKKQQAVQTHCRPVAGGAPFVICYECAMLLQLPSDFLLFKNRRIHRLKCISCSTVLKFQLEKGDHLVPYTPKARGEAIGNGFNQAGLVSQEGNNINERQAAPRRNISSMNRNQVQYTAAEGSSARESPSAPQERQSKVTWKKSPSKGKRVMVESGAGASTSSSMDNTPSRQMKVSGEQQPGRSTSPLHRLMGYSSPSQVLYGSRSTYSDTP